jgi:hypothetical protein
MLGADLDRSQYAFTSGFRRMFVEHVELVVVAHFKIFRRDVHASGIAFAQVVIDYNLHLHLPFALILPSTPTTPGAVGQGF